MFIDQRLRDFESEVFAWKIDWVGALLVCAVDESLRIRG